MTTLDLFAEHERDAAGAVIGTGAVVAHATAELGEQQHDDVVGMVVLAQIGPERLDALANGAPQKGVPRALPGMRIKGAVVAIEDAAADVGTVRLRDPLELTGDRGVRILHRRGVFQRRDFDDVLALQRIDRGLTQIVHDRAAADRRAIHLGEAIEHSRALVALNLRQEAVALQRAGYACDGYAGGDQGARQARSHADDLHDILLVRVEFARNPAEPPFGADLDRLAGVPDVHGPEVRPRRLLPADAVQNGELAVIPELLHRRHVIGDAVGLVDVDDVVVRYTDRRPVIAIERVVVGNDCIDIVVPASQLQNDHTRVSICHSALLLVWLASIVRRTDTLWWRRSAAASRRHADRRLPNCRCPRISGPIHWPEPATAALCRFRHEPVRAGPDSHRPAGRG